MWAALAFLTLIFSVAAVAPGSAAAGRAPAASVDGPAAIETSLPNLRGATALVVDDAHHHVFLTGAASWTTTDSSIYVMNFDGSIASEITGETGAASMVLEPQTSTLYVSRRGGSTIDEIDTAAEPPVVKGSIDASTLAPLTGSLASAAGRLWFGYGACDSWAGGVASIDPAASPPDIRTYSRRLGQEMCAAVRSPGPTSTLLYEFSNGASPMTLRVFDVSVDPPALLVERIEYAGSDSVAFSPNGHRVYAGLWDPKEIAVLRNDDLKIQPLSCSADLYFTGVTVSSNGAYIAATAWWNPDIVLFSVDRDCHVQDRFSVPNATWYPPIGFSGGAAKLFAVDGFYQGLPRFVVVDEPTLIDETISLSFGGSFLGQPVHVTGAMTMSDGSSAAGLPLDLIRTDLDGNQVALPGVVTDSTGAFGIDDTPPTRGIIWYDVAWPGDATHRAASARTHIDVNGYDTTLTLTPSATSVTYGDTVTLSVHLGDHSNDGTVSLWAAPAGQSRILIGAEPVDDNGDLVLTSPVLEYTTPMWADYYGDDEFNPAFSDPITVNVMPKLDGALRRSYAVSDDGYRLYHYDPNCPRIQKGCPIFTARIVPSHAFGSLVFRAQQLGAFGWEDVGTTTVTIDGTGRARTHYTYANESIQDVPLRIRAEFNGDGDHAPTTSSWAYLKITP